MPATIRLRRVGRKKQAAFRIVVANKSDAATGKYIESLGVYNPRTQPSVVRMDGARALHWLRTGAKPSDTVRSILREVGLWERFHDGAEPEDLSPEEAQILRGPKPGEAKTSARGAQATAAAQAEKEEEAGAGPEATAEPGVEESPEADAEAEEDAEPEAEADVAAEEDADEDEDEDDEGEPAAEADEDEEDGAEEEGDQEPEVRAEADDEEEADGDDEDEKES